MTSLKNRKKNTDPLEIDELNEEITPLTSNDNGDDSQQQPSSDILPRINKIMFVLIMLLFAMLISSSSETKKIRKERNAKQLELLSKSIQKQKAALAQKYNSLRSAITNEQSELDVVSKDYHEEELKKLQSNHQEEIDKLSKNHEEELYNKQKEIDLLNADIEKHKKELLNVKSQLDGFEEEEIEFCYECVFDDGNLRTSCGARLEYLVRRYSETDNMTEDDYKSAIIEVDPNCKKTEP